MKVLVISDTHRFLENAEDLLSIYSGKIKDVIHLGDMVNDCKSLMKKYGVDVNHVLRHYDVTGKNCPAPFVENGAAWKNFLNRLREDEEVEKQIKIKLNGVVKSIKAIEKNGYNYVKLQDLRDGKLDVDYDRMPIIRVK